MTSYQNWMVFIHLMNKFAIYVYKWKCCRYFTVLCLKWLSRSQYNDLIVFLKSFLVYPCTVGLLCELCSIIHTAGHGPMNQTAISLVSACICSSALPYPEAAAFTPLFFCPFISPLSCVWLTDMLQPVFPPLQRCIHCVCGLDQCWGT